MLVITIVNLKYADTHIYRCATHRTRYLSRVFHIYVSVSLRLFTCRCKFILDSEICVYIYFYLGKL